MKIDDSSMIKSYGRSAAETVDKALDGLPSREAWILTTSIFIYCVRQMIILVGLQKAIAVIAEAILTAPGIESELEEKDRKQ